MTIAGKFEFSIDLRAISLSFFCIYDDRGGCQPLHYRFNNDDEFNGIDLIECLKFNIKSHNGPISSSIGVYIPR